MNNPEQKIQFTSSQIIPPIRQRFCILKLAKSLLTRTCKCFGGLRLILILFKDGPFSSKHQPSLSNYITVQTDSFDLQISLVGGFIRTVLNWALSTSYLPVYYVFSGFLLSLILPPWLEVWRFCLLIYCSNWTKRSPAQGSLWCKSAQLFWGRGRKSSRWAPHFIVSFSISVPWGPSQHHLQPGLCERGDWHTPAVPVAVAGHCRARRGRKVEGPPGHHRVHALVGRTAGESHGRVSCERSCVWTEILAVYKQNMLAEPDLAVGVEKVGSHFACSVSSGGGVLWWEAQHSLHGLAHWSR